MYLQRERDDLLKRIRPGTSYTNDLSKAVIRCFECADVVAQRRRELSFDTTLTAEQRRETLSDLVHDLVPHLAELVRPARQAKTFVEAERKKLQPGIGLDRGTLALMQDAQAVDAALYFAGREMAPAGGLSAVDFEMLTQPS